MNDPFGPLKDRAWAEIAEIDRRLARGEIDEAQWHEEIAALVVPAYVGASTPREGSGKSGTRRDSDYARSHIAHAIDRPGSFLDIGCANGYLLECLPRWTEHRLELHGLDIAPPLVELARRRLPDLAARLHIGNGLTWQAGRQFDYARTNFDYVPARRRRELFENLRTQAGRVIVGVFNEQSHERPTEDLVKSWGFRIMGRSERANLSKPQIDYRVFCVDRKGRGD